MRQNICVGAVDAANGALLRLIPRVGAEYHSWQQFNADTGDLISLVGNRSTALDPPHVEDFLVDKWSAAGKINDLPSWIRSKCLVWRGNRSVLFDGKLRYTTRGKGHINRGDPLPNNSVGFWELPAPLTLELGEKKRYTFTEPNSLSAPYVGITSPQQTIAQGTLVRVSLSRWWAPDDGSMPEACWLQISGCY